MQAHRRVKIISLGDPAVGKSCLIKRYCEQRVRVAPALRSAAARVPGVSPQRRARNSPTRSLCPNTWRPLAWTTA